MTTQRVSSERSPGCGRECCSGGVKHGGPRRGRQSARASHLRHGGPAPADPPGVDRHPQEDDQEGEPRLTRMRPQRVPEDEKAREHEQPWHHRIAEHAHRPGQIGAPAAGFVLRRRRPDLPRPVRVLGYPVVPWLFVLASFLILGNALWAHPRETGFAFLIIFLGVPVYSWWIRRRGSAMTQM